MSEIFPNVVLIYYIVTVVSDSGSDWMSCGLLFLKFLEVFMELVKDIIVFVVIPLVSVVFRILLSKISALETAQKEMPSYDYCMRFFAQKTDIATKKDISDMLDAKFEKFELRLINEGRIEPFKRL